MIKFTKIQFISFVLALCILGYSIYLYSFERGYGKALNEQKQTLLKNISIGADWKQPSPKKNIPIIKNTTGVFDSNNNNQLNYMSAEIDPNGKAIKGQIYDADTNTKTIFDYSKDPNTINPIYLSVIKLSKS